MKKAIAVDYELVKKIALSLEGVEEGMSYGAPALKAKGNLMVRLSEELDSIVVKTTFDVREELMAAQPDIYYITDHYLSYPWVLVHLGRVHPDALSELIRTAHSLAKPRKRQENSRE